MTNAPVVVLASEADVQAKALPRRLPYLDVRLLTPRDLSRPGWEFRPGRSEGVAVVSGAPVSAPSAVLVRLPWVAEPDLPHITARDRSYVAAEMTAVLLAWLSSLPCPVINRPSTTCLAGPLWRPERWAMVAAAVGLPAAPVHRSAGMHNPPRQQLRTDQEVVITVVGKRSLGTRDARLSRLLPRLARAAGADVLAVRLTEPGPAARLLAAGPWVDYDDEEVLDAILDLGGVSGRAASTVPIR